MVFKWLKKNKSNRRCSDSHFAMISGDSEFCSSPRSDALNRTEEDKRALGEFFARRSLGANVKHGKNFQLTPEKAPSTKLFGDPRKIQSEKKPKRRSNSDVTSEEVPEVQFLFSNQVFMPGSSLPFFKKKTHGKSNQKDRKTKRDDHDGSLISTSPDLLPPKCLRNRHVDFDSFDDDLNTPPPDDFFRDNSLPYQDKENAPPVTTSPDEEAPVQRPSRKEEIKVDLEAAMQSVQSESKDLNVSTESDWSNDSNYSCCSAVRKLEQKCSIYGVSRGFGYFRGVPLVKRSALNFDGGDTPNKNWFKGTWKHIPVTVKRNPCLNSLPGDKSFVEDITIGELDILTKVRHPNILLLMGLFYNNDEYLQCFYEETTGSLYEYIHVEKNILSAQQILNYLCGIANALLYLKTNKYIHTAVSSHSIILTSKDTAKLCNFELCSRIRTKRLSRKNTSCYIPHKLSFSPEPEYANLKDFQRNEDQLWKFECKPQCVSNRSMFSPFRWQPPELFNDHEGLVFPNIHTDVYSLCLVMWECYNHSVPWKTVSYEQLCEFYFEWKTGIRLPNDSNYPSTVREILTKGLHLKANERWSIEELAEKLKGSLEQINVTKEFSTLSKTVEENISTNFDAEKCVIVNMKNIRKFEVTDLDNENAASPRDAKLVTEHSNPQFHPEYLLTESKSDCVYLSLVKSESSKENSSETSANLESFSGTNSTGYRSVETPSVQRLTSKFRDSILSMVPSKIEFSDERQSKTLESETTEKTVKLNPTPKTYKSLQIVTPTDEKLDNLRTLVKNYDLHCENERKSSYAFEIQNSSLPLTPIARNTKIRRNAWLSDGKKVADSETNECSKTSDPEVSHDEMTKKIKEVLDESNNFDDSKLNLSEKIVSRGIRRHSLVNFKFDCLNSISHIENTKDDCIQSQPDPCDTFKRIRSHSFSYKPTVCPKSVDDVTGVDIKPLVAIHEKWILEANHKQGHSTIFPENYRGSLHAVKPASHLIDPLRPKNGANQQNFDIDRKRDVPKFGNYCEISPMIRSSVFKKKVINSKPADFFENSLWQKEKELCLQTSCKNNPQGSSTPRNKQTIIKKHELVDKHTNTDTFEELCAKILSASDQASSDKSSVNVYTPTNGPDIFGIKNDTFNAEKDVDFEIAKSSILNELSMAFEKRSSVINETFKNAGTKFPINNPFVNSTINKNDHIGNVTVTIGREDENFQAVIEDGHSESERSKTDDLNVCTSCRSSSCEDEFTPSEKQDDGLINKTLKRCQAFSTLQNARSTEDMYIDDELHANIDLQNLSENMKLVPFDGTLHEAMCSKGSECCLIKIQEEASCDRILLFCKSFNRKRSHSSASSSSDLVEANEDKYESTEPKDSVQTLSVERLPSVDLIDLAYNSKALPVIEEQPSEDEGDSENDLFETTGKVQDLISLYENEKLSESKSVKYDRVSEHDSSDIKSKIDLFEKDVSVIIINEVEHKSHSNQTNQFAKDPDLDDSVIGDIVHV